MNWLLLIGVVVTAIWLYKRLSPSSHHWKYGNSIPGPKPIPILGNALIFLSKKTIIETLNDLVRNYGPVSRLWLGKQLFLLLKDPKDIQVFLSHTIHLNKSDSYRLLDSWLGNKGILTSNVDSWRIHRKLLTPSFHFKILENAVPMIEKHAKILCQQLEPKIDQPEFDVSEYIEKCSLDIICETAMGIDLQCQTAQYSEYLDKLKTITKAIIARIFSPWLHPQFLFSLSSLGKKYNEALGVIKSHVLKVIMDRKEALMGENNIVDLANENGTKTPKPFLDFMLTKSNFTNQEIEDEVQTIMFAGHDTTKAAISFTLYALSQNPHVQDKLIEEIDEMVANKGDNLSLQDYLSMKYLDNVIKEALRMYTPVPFIARTVDEDIILPSGFTLPADSTVNFCLLMMHNDENNFKNPDEFMPERFENQEEHNPFAYVPFSAGPRNCIGQRFANIEMRIVLFTFFKKYQLLPATKITSLQLETCIVLHSLNGIPIKLISRN